MCSHIGLLSTSAEQKDTGRHTQAQRMMSPAETARHKIAAPTMLLVKSRVSKQVGVLHPVNHYGYVRAIESRQTAQYKSDQQ